MILVLSYLSVEKLVFKYQLESGVIGMFTARLGLFLFLISHLNLINKYDMHAAPSCVELTPADWKRFQKIVVSGKTNVNIPQSKHSKVTTKLKFSLFYRRSQ